MTIEKKTELIKLFSLYQSLLTDTQQTYFKAYVEEDFSFKEIAEAYDVSRSAIHDQIHKIEKHLYAYEEKLHLLKTREQRLSLLDAYEEKKDASLLQELRKLDE